MAFGNRHSDLNHANVQCPNAQMIAFPLCKINLGLHVISKREDGYHNIETCFYPAPQTDILEIVKSDVFEFTHSGLPIPGGESENLCCKAYQLLKKKFGIGSVKIHLHKIIPMGAGFGGGSSDAAYTLRLLNQIFELEIKPEDLQKLAAQLGSDCSFFIQDVPMIGIGRGEILTPAKINLKGYFLILVKPPIHVSTADAYAGIIPKNPVLSIPEILESPIAEWKKKLVNDFEDTIFEKAPLIKNVKEKLYKHGAIYASMSGSGASVYGIFSKPIDLKQEFSDMDYWSGELK